ncbi:hypothetical protein EWE75_23745 [Sphingomonas populi]|uniref:Uncharacterized protein n=1 Tax=Sphingomonas populi TaxID=2484750 RepID=A0A4Q6XGQ8_9SPHN|nr:VC0807 family protein [Sphingomonas populi]RZF59071.1 hypothetical protein EWE75_23745 [Sphingomonas populi]
MIDIAQARTMLLTKGPAIAADIGVNFVLPYVIYSYAAPVIGDVKALLASSVPPILWSVIEFIRRRRLDAVSLLVLAGIVLSLLAFIGGGGPRMLQLREKLVSGVIGMVFLISAAIGRPLMYELARAGMARRGSADSNHLYDLPDDRGFRRSMIVMTVVWGFGLILDVAIGAALVFSLTIKEYMIVNSIEGYALLGGLIGWTFWYGRRSQTGNEALREAEVEQLSIARRPDRIQPPLRVEQQSE